MSDPPSDEQGITTDSSSANSANSYAHGTEPLGSHPPPPGPIRPNDPPVISDVQTQSFDSGAPPPLKDDPAGTKALQAGSSADKISAFEVDEKVVRVTASRLPEVEGYVLLEELGRGGMGVVYKARQLALKRDVALKMILAGSHAGSGQVRRFVAEADAVARLHHANIVQIYEVGQREGLHYFSMELVEDGVLEKFVRAAPQPAREAAGHVELLARAMQHAHEQGVVHRDLKPANILLRRKQGGAVKEADGRATLPLGRSPQLGESAAVPLSAFEPKITDFGLAKFLDEHEGQTKTGAVAGTPSYMAPEQAAGRTKEAGPATDVYALGAILYKLVTGRPPFHADTAIITLQQVVSEEPVAPTRLQSRIPRDLETICLKCLQKEPAKRYRSAGDLAEDLRRFQAGEPIVARPTPAWERAWKWTKRRPAVASLAALIVAVTVVGFGLVTWQWLRADRERDRADGERDRAVELADRESKERARADAKRLEAQRVSAGLLRERGVGLCEQGEYGRGLLWLARALGSTPAEAEDLRDSLRVLLGGWSRHVGRVKAVFSHTKDVMATALSPDGKTVVTGGLDGLTRLWDAATGKPLGESLRGGGGQVLTVAFSPDGRTLVTGSSTGVVCLWDWAGGRLLHKISAHKGQVWNAVFSPDGRLVGTAGFDGAARLWEASSGEAVGELRHTGAVTAIVFTSDGTRAMTASRDHTVRRWDVKNHQQVGDAWKLGKEVWALALTRDGQMAATVELDRTGGDLRLWRVDKGKPLGDPARLAARVGNIAFSPHGERMVTGSEDGTTRVWDMHTLKPVGEPLRHQPGKEITGVAFSSDGQMILTSGRDGTARLWDVSAMLPSSPPLRAGPVGAVSFSPKGDRILTIEEDTVQQWEVGTGQPLGAAMRHEGPVQCATFRPDGRMVLTGDRSGAVRRWDAATGQPIGETIAHPGAVLFALFSPDGQMILTGCLDNMARLWDARSGKLLGELPPDDAPLKAKAQFSPSGEGIVLFAGNIARLWRVSTRKAIGPPLRHPGPITTAVFSPDGRMVATASLDKTVRLWDAATGEALSESAAHQEEGPVMDVAFSPSGRTILTRNLTTGVRLWETRTWKPIGEPLRHPGAVNVSLFSPDGRVILTGGGDRTIRLWDAATGKPLGEPLPQAGGVFFAAFRADSRMLASSSSEAKGYLVRLWQVMPPMPGDVEQIKRRLQADTGLELDATDAIHWLSPAAWKQRQQQLNQREKPTPK